MTIVILGGGIKDGKLPSQVKKRLLKGLNLSEKKDSENFLLCGRWSFLLDEKPKKTEARLMKEFLVSKGVDEDRIHLEEKSMDTISNAYFAKTEYFLNRNELKAVVVSSNYHIPRVKYIFEKTFGDSFNLEFVGIDTDPEERLVKRQEKLLEEMKEFTKGMKDGDHEFLKDKFFDDHYYNKKRPDWIKRKTGIGIN